MKKLYNSARTTFCTNDLWAIYVIDNYYDIYCVEARKISNIFIVNPYFPQRSWGTFDLRIMVNFIDRLLLKKINEKII